MMYMDDNHHDGGILRIRHDDCLAIVKSKSKIEVQSSSISLDLLRILEWNSSLQGRDDYQRETGTYNREPGPPD